METPLSFTRNLSFFILGTSLNLQMASAFPFAFNVTSQSAMEYEIPVRCNTTFELSIPSTDDQSFWSKAPLITIAFIGCVFTIGGFVISFKQYRRAKRQRRSKQYRLSDQSRLEERITKKLTRRQSEVRERSAGSLSHVYEGQRDAEPSSETPKSMEPPTPSDLSRQSTLITDTEKPDPLFTLPNIPSSPFRLDEFTFLKKNCSIW